MNFINLVTKLKYRGQLTSREHKSRSWNFFFFFFSLKNYLVFCYLDKEVFHSHTNTACVYNVSQNEITVVGSGLFTLENPDIMQQFNFDQIRDLSKKDVKYDFNNDETLMINVKSNFIFFKKENKF